MKPLSRQSLQSIVGLLFVISGGLGLMYQIVWFKYLSLFLGNTMYAQTIVLATFMGGLAIGSAWWGRIVDRTLHPLRLYAFLELGIGLSCLLYPTVIELLKNVFISIVVSSQLPSDGTVVLFLKLLTSLCSLLVPTILMGGTLPILVRFISHKLEESGRSIAILYFLNCFGAVIGSLLTGFFFIRILGLSATVYLAAVINLLVGGSAYFLSMWNVQPQTADIEESTKTEQHFPRREIVLAVTVAGISGLAAMIYEVTWVRMLIPVIGSSTYSFSLMLAAFISGITFGSFLVSTLVHRIKNLFLLLGWCQVGIVLSMLAALPLYGRIPYEFWKVASMLTRSDATYPIYLTIQFLFGFLMMIVPTIFLGMSLPVATRIAARDIHILGTSVGNVFAVNTLGTVLGSLLAGFVLIPLVGVKHTMEIGVGCNLLAAMLIFFFGISVSRRHIGIAVPVMVVTLTAYFFFVPHWDKSVMLSGVFRQTNSKAQPPSSYEEFVTTTTSAKVYYYREGTTATVGVVESKIGNETQKVLMVNGKADASSKGDLPTQLLLGQLPCLIHKNPQNILVVGLGSGVTVGSILTHPVQHVDCVEISPEIVEASSQFDDVNHRPLNDSRMHLTIEDALAYLKLTPGMYDVIVSEPTNPWIAGVGNLFTVEFFELCKSKMNPGGLMVQWFHLYEMNDDLFKMVVRTFQSSFPSVSMWQPSDVDVIMIGSLQPLSLDYDKIQAAMTVKEINEDLKRIRIPDATTLLSVEMLSPGSVGRYVGVGDLNTEDHPRLEYNAPVAFFINTGVTQLQRFDERIRCDSVGLLLKRRMNNKQVTDDELRSIGFLHTSRHPWNLHFGYSILRDLQSKYPRDGVLLERVASAAERLNLFETALGYRKTITGLEPNNPNALESYAWLKFSIENQWATILTPVETKESEDLLYKSIGLVADTVDRYRYRLANVYYGTQRYAKALEQYARTIQLRRKYMRDPNIPDDILFLRLAICFNRLGINDRAFGSALQAVNINPRNEEARNLIYEMWTKGMNPSKRK